MGADCPDLERFVRGEIDTAAFPGLDNARWRVQGLLAQRPQ